MANTKLIAVTADEAAYLLDKISFRDPASRRLALTMAGVVLEFASDDARAEALVARATGSEQTP